MTLRHALLGAILALPLALLALATPPGDRLLAVGAALPVVAGLIALDVALRARVPDGTAFWTIVLAAYATPVFPLLAHAPDAQRATAFLLGALALVTPRARWGGVVLLAGGLAIGGLTIGGPGLARAWFGSRGGLLFETPLLWACLLGLVPLAKRDGRAAAPLVTFGLLPFVLSPLARTGALDVALPVLLLGLATALEAACRLAARRPAWALAAVIPILALSNLLFMEQYRYTLKRDDTVSFPQVSEGNARLLSKAVGSPIAWPANWIWSARTDLPVERWDLLSGQRLDPRLGAVIDVGDVDQDAAFLLGGWSVRHACGDAVCREVEGRGEMAIPLELEAHDLVLQGTGPGTLHVTLNGWAAGSIVFGPELGTDLVPIPKSARRRGRLLRVVLEPDPGTRVLVDRVSFVWKGER